MEDGVKCVHVLAELIDDTKEYVQKLQIYSAIIREKEEHGAEAMLELICSNVTVSKDVDSSVSKLMQDIDEFRRNGSKL